eukprot:3699939-Pleurochrysis_carterae.AAC.3
MSFGSFAARFLHSIGSSRAQHDADKHGCFELSDAEPDGHFDPELQRQCFACHDPRSAMLNIPESDSSVNAATHAPSLPIRAPDPPAQPRVGGRVICQHGRQRRVCRDCGGRDICQHGRRQRVCKDCGGADICEHNRVRYACKVCREAKRLWAEDNGLMGEGLAPAAPQALKRQRAIAP